MKTTANKIDCTFSRIAEEVKILHEEIVSISEHDPVVKSLYKGCQILFSPLIEKPEILLVGFNPGGGYASWYNRIVENFTPMEAMEYYLNKHSLAEQTKSLFRTAGFEKILENRTIKTNFYYWASNNVADFYELTKKLPQDTSERIFHQARVWNRKFIDIVQPQLIIAEGFTVFSELEILFSDKENSEVTDNYKFFGTQQFQVFAYKRNQASIVNKEEVSKKLKQILTIQTY